uniref:Neugrin n=1 Tax=Nothobranchius korthausae TaxID=1143690 RepID=A0A1A8HIR5_9TELE
MAGRVQFFSLLYKLRASSVISSASLNSYRFSSRSNKKTWTGQSFGVDKEFNYQHQYRDDGSEDLEDVEDKLQALLNEGRKRQKTVKYHILRRQMSPPGAPPRKLTWDAIEQIRYLKQELPEEWTVERLAEGFSVTPDVISRVLSSKFTPPPTRKAKQDAKVMSELRLGLLPSGAKTPQNQLKLAGNHTPAILTPGNKEDALVSVTGQTQMIKGSPVRSLAPITGLTPQLTKGPSKEFLEASADGGENNGSQLKEEGDEPEDSWDGEVLTEEELKEFLELDNPPVVQVGKDVFDEEGTFLYRI